MRGPGREAKEYFTGRRGLRSGRVMGVRIVATYRPAKKRSYEKGLHLEYLKRESRWIFRNQKTRSGSSRRRRRMAVDERLCGGCVAVLLHGGGGGCAAVRCLLIPHVCGRN